MANPEPTLKPDNLKPWQPGQSGNPDGYSRKRRFADKLIEAIETDGYDPDLIKAIVGKATGRIDLLTDANGNVREPCLNWFNALTAIIDGPAVTATETTEQAPRIAIPNVDDRYPTRLDGSSITDSDRDGVDPQGIAGGGSGR